MSQANQKCLRTYVACFLLLVNLKVSTYIDETVFSGIISTSNQSCLICIIVVSDGTKKNVCADQECVLTTLDCIV